MSTMTENNNIIVFSIDDQKYALTLDCIERAVRIAEIAPLPEAPSTILGVINIQGRFVPVVNTRKVLRLPEKELQLSDQLIVARMSGRTAALVVDEVHNVIECPENAFISSDEILPDMDYVRGVAKLQDDTIYIFDSEKISFFKEEAVSDNSMEKILEGQK